MFFLRIPHSTISGLNAKGRNTITATTHLQKARLIGGIPSLRPRAMIKLPDQIAVAPMAKKYPEISCWFCSRFINLGISNFFIFYIHPDKPEITNSKHQKTNKFQYLNLKQEPKQIICSHIAYSCFDFFLFLNLEF